MAYALPVYKIKGKYYFRDKRLGEYRNVDNIMDKIDIFVGDSLVENPKATTKKQKEALKRLQKAGIFEQY
jgi:hypothetical protein